MTFVRRATTLIAAGLGAVLAAGLAAQPAHAAPEVTGAFTITAKTLYLGPEVAAAPTAVTFSGLPAGTDEVRINWGVPGDTTAVSPSARTAKHSYQDTGTFTVTVTLYDDEQGESEPRTVGTVSVRQDNGDPTAKLTKPKKANRVSSWKTIKGSSADSASGVLCVVVAVFERRAKTWYYFTGKTWKKGSPYSQAAVDKAFRVYLPAKSGAWSVKVKNLKKGKLIALYYAIDKVGNAPDDAKVVQANLTR